MRKVVSFKSIRNIKNIGSRSWDIVFEWEDILSEGLNLKIENDGFLKRKFKRLFQVVGLYNFFNVFPSQKTVSLEFVTNVRLFKHSRANQNVIPIIIDFWYSEKEIPGFINYFKEVPLLLVTNREVYVKLQKYDLPFPVEHFPLSLPDKYAISKCVLDTKDIDFCFFGRQNPLFLRYIKQYCKNHSEFVYVYNEGISTERKYITNTGVVIQEDKGRESYMNLLKRTKISCYTTPGYDESKTISKEYNQVTPRVLEMLSNGCQVIGHYPNTEDVEWYDLKSVVPNVDSYDQFERVLDKFRKEDYNYDLVSKFLSNHYTTKTIPVLRDILKKYGLL